MTDAEIDALAQNIFSDVSTDVITIAPQVCRVLHNSRGQPFLEFVGISKDGFGAFRYHYYPIEPIKKLITESEKLYDEFDITLRNRQSGETYTKKLKDIPAESRTRIIGSMARIAALQMIGRIFPNLTELIADAFREATIVAEAVLIGTIANSPDADDEVVSYVNTDMTATIEEAVRETADRKRKKLQTFLRSTPYVIAVQGSGRKRKTIYQLKQEADEYSTMVESAYRAERLAVGKKPTKVSVATRLREGGVDPARGSDTRLNAFNLKLARYGINYEQNSREG